MVDVNTKWELGWKSQIEFVRITFSINTIAKLIP